VNMKLVNSAGKSRLREMTLLRKNIPPGGDQRFFVYFHTPADVKGMTFMVWKYLDKQDDRWIYIPAIHLVRRIAASDKRSSFIGSDFTNEDLSGRDPDDEDHRLMPEGVVSGRACHVVESHPHTKVDYVRRVSWIDKTWWLPLKEEYFDARGVKVRVFTADKVQRIGGHWTVTRRTMRNEQTGHHTEVVFTKVAYDVGFTLEVFTEQSLRRPPSQWTDSQ